METHMFNINDQEVVVMTNKLERIHRSALPIAIRSTLNDAAFETRKLALGNFKRQFIIRVPSFIRSHLEVHKSQNTFDITQMESECGIPQGKSIAGNQLKIQEIGGRLKNRNVPTVQAREGEREKSLISKGFYQKIWMNKPKGRIYRSSESTLIKTESALLRVLRGGVWRTLFLLKRDVKVDERPFITPAGKEVMGQIPGIYGKQGKRQIEKYLMK
jgi:hypothetical protein